MKYKYSIEEISKLMNKISSKESRDDDFDENGIKSYRKMLAENKELRNELIIKLLFETKSQKRLQRIQKRNLNDLH